MMLEAAKRYRDFGLRPIPLKGKRPVLDGWQKLDMPTIENLEWCWREWPEANVGVVVPKDIIILDVDTVTTHDADGEAALAGLEAAHEMLPSTWTGQTGGGGRHLWFRLPGGVEHGNKRGNLPKGIDVRGGSRGQVVVWPSIHPITGKQYTWEPGKAPWECELATIPAWMLGIVIPPKPEPKEPTPAREPRRPDPSDSRRTRWAWAAIEAEAGAVARSQEPGRNERLNAAAFSLGQVVGGGAINEAIVIDALRTAAQECGLGEKESRETIASGLRAGKEKPRTPPERELRTVRPEPELPPDLDGDADEYDDRTPLVDDADVTLARALLHELGTRDEVVFDEGSLYRYDPDVGVWGEFTRAQQWVSVSRQNGRWFVVGKKSNGEPQVKRLKINQGKISGATKIARFHAEQAGFFAAAPHGVAFNDRFVTVTDKGIATSALGPEQRRRSVLEVPYTPGIYPSRWFRFLAEVFALDPHAEKTAQTLQEFFGACLLGIATRYERCILLSGVGANGKSVILEVMAGLFPMSAKTSIEPQAFGRGFKLAELAGKLLNVVNEVPDANVAGSERFKAVVSGNLIMAERKNQDPFNFIPIAGHIFACNVLPGTTDASPGFFRRFLVIPMDRTFAEHEQEKGLGKALVRDELAGIAAWAVKGAERLLAQDSYTISPTTHKYTEEWRTDADRVRAWVKEKCVVVPVKDGLAPSQLYKDFREWIVENGFSHMSIATFGSRLTGLGLKKASVRKDGRSRPLRPLKFRSMVDVRADDADEFFAPGVGHA